MAKKKEGVTKYASRLFILLLGTSTAYAGEPDKDCVDWFNQENIQVGSRDCELKCATIMTDMGTFTCPDQCNRLCMPKEKESLLSKFVFYPGLTQSEKQLVVKNPKEAYLVFQQKGLAEDSTDRNFPDQDLNDESDAFRHFIWSGLLTKQLGREKAKVYLDAHEANPLQSEREKQMDTFNNERGQTAAEILIKNNKWSEKNLETKALGELRKKRVEVIMPGLPIPMEPK